MGSDDEEENDTQNAQERALADLPKYDIRRNELREDLFLKVLIYSVDALKKHKLQKDIAQYIKEQLDKDDNFNELIGKGPWQVIVGRNLAAAFTHEALHLSFFDIPKYQETILVYKSLGVQSV